VAVTYKEIFEDAFLELNQANIEAARDEALLLFSKHINKDRSYIISRMDEALPTEFNQKSFTDLIKRRSKHEPFAYLYNEREFFNRPFKVGPGVLIPRPETEHLIEKVVEENAKRPFKNITDICCGSGIIGITLQKELGINVQMFDISKEALAWAERNVNFHNVRNSVKIKQCDILKDYSLIDTHTDCITMNPPYICPNEIPSLNPDVIEYEPLLALDGGEKEGLEFTLKCIHNFAQIVANHTHLFIELGYKQKNLLESQSLYPWTIQNWKKDLAGIPRVVHLIKNQNG